MQDEFPVQSHLYSILEEMDQYLQQQEQKQEKPGTLSTQKSTDFLKRGGSVGDLRGSTI